MEKTFTLWHLSGGNPHSLEREGLFVKQQKTCVGGQEEGIYFFTQKRKAKMWALNEGIPYYSQALCSTQIPVDSIRFPQWGLDLFFNRKMISTLANFLHQHFKNQLDKDGKVAVDISSQIAFDDCVDNDWFFKKEKVTITQIHFKESACFLTFKRPREFFYGKPKTPENENIIKTTILSNNMEMSYLGLADTMSTYLCQRNDSYLKYYNILLRKQLHRTFKTGAIKYRGNKNMPVSVKKYEITKDPLFLGLLILTGVTELGGKIRGYRIQRANRIQSQENQLGR